MLRVLLLMLQQFTSFLFLLRFSLPPQPLEMQHPYLQRHDLLLHNFTCSPAWLYSFKEDCWCCIARESLVVKLITVNHNLFTYILYQVLFVQHDTQSKHKLLKLNFSQDHFFHISTFILILMPMLIFIFIHILHNKST